MLVIASLVWCSCDDDSTGPEDDGPSLVEGRSTFRFDTFGDETFWSDTLRIHETISSSVSPNAALLVGLKVDVDALPEPLKAELSVGSVDLNSPATTVRLLELGAVVGVVGQVEGDTLKSVGITCALCHSTVDDSFAPGIGKRLDGWPNLDLDPGAIIALSPALSVAQQTVYNSWGPGKYDPRFNIDGKSFPVVIPPAYGLDEVEAATYTGDGDVPYWNRYVAVTQMHGHGTFTDARIGVDVNRPPDLVSPKLDALEAYQLSLRKPSPPTGSFDAVAAVRGRVVFDGAGQCASCHAGERYTDDELHDAAETGQEGFYASRSATGKYRTTPLRALWQHPPYFHDGHATTLEAVVDHYVTNLGLSLTVDQRADLVEFLKSL
jgi:hypothetical protein